MMVSPRTPVLVGVGQVNHADGDAPEPVDLLVEAALRAAADSGAPNILGHVESVRVVRIVSRRYLDPGRLVADSLRLNADHTVYTTDGGQTPQVLVNRAALQIERGELDVVLIGGAEAWRTRRRYKRLGQTVPWTGHIEQTGPDENYGDELQMTDYAERSVGLTDPVQAYPMFENALRAKHRRTFDEQQTVAATLWSRFSRVASRNPYAAIREVYTAQHIASASAENRPISVPYTKLMNSNSSVDQAAALLICSAERADSLGVPRDRWIFLHGAAEANDVAFMSHRVDLAASPAIRFAGEAVLRFAATNIDEVAHVDLYSCFPSAVQIAASELGLALERQLTVTGGLTFAGGPWNNYVTHSIATMAGVLREDPDSLGLCSANGGLLTKHAVALYGCRPPRHGTQLGNVQGLVNEVGAIEAVPDYKGVVSIETYTVMYETSGEPKRAFLACRTDDARRVMASGDHPELIAMLLAEDPLNARVHVQAGRAVI